MEGAVRDIADVVSAVVPGCEVRYAQGGGPDPRSYRVDCSKLPRTLPAFRPRWTLRGGVEALYDAFRVAGMTRDQFASDRYVRIRHIRRLQRDGRLDPMLRWTITAMERAGAET